jgi:hypothetical protein
MLLNLESEIKLVKKNKTNGEYFVLKSKQKRVRGLKNISQKVVKVQINIKKWQSYQRVLWQMT